VEEIWRRVRKTPRRMTKPAHIFILTGAGISAESGLGTFRDVDGLWTRYDLSEVASIDGYRRKPRLVLDFYNARFANLETAAPNAAHHAIGRLQSGLAAQGRRLTLVTQNVDDLHEKGGAADVIHMHGELRKVRCGACDTVFPRTGPTTLADGCAACGAVGHMRPHIVWFGEYPLHLDHIYTALVQADLFVAIGTSGAVYPAAGLVDAAREAGVDTMEINLDPSDNAAAFHQRLYGKASETVPAWVAEVLAAR
jgi:NAD-dependent deacetylase